MSRSVDEEVAAEVNDDDLTRAVIGCAIKVHKALGVGLLESAYEEFFSHELVKNGFRVARQVTLPVAYDGVTVDLGFRPDLVINNELIVELKTVKQLLPTHDAQILTYLKLSGITRGLLMNCHALPLSKGIKRFVLNYKRGSGLYPQ